jgi:predicted ATPase/DNA-binding SARP family transcriptional activator
MQRRKNVALLAYLATTGRSHSREALVTLLWPEVEPSRARTNLRRNLSALRKALGGEALVVKGETVGLAPDALWLDVAEFQRLLRAWEGHGHPEREVCARCLAALEEAAKLYRGDFLAGFSLRDSADFDEWQFFQTEGLRQDLAGALERLVQGHGAGGKHEEAIGHARRWVALDPLHEPAQRELMRSYAAGGQRSASLRQYGECERVLAEELGVEPEAETMQLYRAIRERRDWLRSVEPAPVAAAEARHNLPVQPTPFVGREGVLAEIAARLQDPECRLLTLVGPGGSGKTRLALEAARARLADHEDGVYFVSLTPLRSAESVVPTVAQAVGLPLHGASDPRELLLNYLRRRRMLLILDSFEHLLESAELVADMLQSAPDVKILATSRARLRVRAEQPCPIGGMSYPDATVAATDPSEYSALKLFLAGARRADPVFDLCNGSLADVAHICRLVAGLPLAIEMAAAWVEVLSPSEIADRISDVGGGGEGLDFLGTELADVADRQRSMRAVFDHSWDLLTGQQQEVFEALSIFRGEFTARAAERIAGASLRDLKGLMDRSLLRRTAARRFAMHSLLCQYAEGRLRQSVDRCEEIGNRHCAYYVAALEQWDEDRKGPRQQEALARMDLDIEDARAAWAWAVDHLQVERLARAAYGLVWWYRQRWRWQECDADCSAALERLQNDEAAWGRMHTPSTGEDPSPGRGLAAGEAELERLLASARILWGQRFSRQAGGEFYAVASLARGSLALLAQAELASQKHGLGLPADSRRDRAVALLQLGYSASDGREAKRLSEQAAAMCEAIGDRWHLGLALEAAGLSALGLGAYDQARDALERSLSAFQSLGDRWETAWLTLDLGMVAALEGRLDEAQESLEAAIAGHREYQDPLLLPTGRYWQALVLWLAGDFGLARARAKESCATERGGISLNREGGAAAHALVGLTEIHLGQWEAARESADACHSVRGVARCLGCPPAAILHSCLALVDGERELSSGTGEDRRVPRRARGAQRQARRIVLEDLAELRQRGERTSVAQVLAVVGAMDQAMGEPRRAADHLSEALWFSAETGAFMPPLFALPAAALLLADSGDAEPAIEVYALASRYPFVANSVWHELVFGRHIEASAASMPPEVVDAARECGRARDMRETCSMLAQKLGGGGNHDVGD